MKKITKKASVRTSMRHYMDPPDVMNMDVISYASDEDLDRRIGYLLAEREQAASLDIDTRLWEEEICYVQREMRIRSARRTAHERYVRFNPESYNSWAPASASEEEVELN